MTEPVGTTGEVPEQVLLARAYLSRVCEPANLALFALVDRIGPVRAARAVRDGSVAVELDGATAARRTTADPAADLEAADRLGLRLLVPESPDWPSFAFGALERCAQARLRQWRAGRTGGSRFRRSDAGEPVPPVALWVRGRPGALDASALGWRSAGIVGSRAATGYGEHVARELGHDLTARGVTVVSGGAYGIDAAAHRGALVAGGPTVLVSAGGLDRPYPPGNATLYDRVAEQGLLLSESPPGCAPHRSRFLSRNRLIAALSTGVVVVEAAQRSGAANTVSHARVLGRPVMAVPGPVGSAMSTGCHELIRSGAAELVQDADDVLAVVGAAGEGIPGARAGDRVGRDGSVGASRAGGSAGTTAVADVRSRLDALDPTARRVFDGLSTRVWAAPGRIAARAGVSALEVVRALPALELAGLLEISDAGYRVAPAGRPGGSA